MRKWIPFLLLIVIIAAGLIIWSPDLVSFYGNKNKSNGLIPENIDSLGVSALIDSEGIMTVRAYCTGCHSEKLITQNRATREGWEAMIRWMQQTQNLGDLGENEMEILDYLATNYAPDRKGRRASLKVEWYSLEE